MIAELDREMERRSLDGVVVFAGGGFEPALFYVTRGGRMRRAVWVKTVGERPFIVHEAMERDELSHLDCDLKSFGAYDLARLATEAGSELGGWIEFFRRVLRERKVRGRVALCGRLEVSKWLPLIDALRDGTDGIEIVSGGEIGLFEALRLTKDDSEIDTMRKLGAATVEVMAQVAGVLKRGVVRAGEVFVDGTPLTLGHLKEVVRLEFAKRGLMEESPSIVSMGAEAGVPHNRGTDSSVVREGSPIIVDIFPAQIGGGYCSDMTRTFCVGKPSRELEELYSLVLEVQEKTLRELKVSTEARIYQDLACAFFESRGHPTVTGDPTIIEGYVHGLGHGVGLDIHELPRLGGGKTNTMKLGPGMVFTVEPGLYYPSRGLGVRIEDTVCFDSDGRLRILTEFPKRLSAEEY